MCRVVTGYFAAGMWTPLCLRREVTVVETEMSHAEAFEDFSNRYKASDDCWCRWTMYSPYMDR
jgi:hypothetical protein